MQRFLRVAASLSIRLVLSLGLLHREVRTHSCERFKEDVAFGN